VSKSSQKQKSLKPSAQKTGGLNDDQRTEIRELFEDVYIHNKKKIITTNFIRGIAFGFGTFLGGTIIVALIIWILSQTIDLFPPIRDFSERLIDALKK
jgi:hypothetical protein